MGGGGLDPYSPRAATVRDQVKYRGRHPRLPSRTRRLNLKVAGPAAAEPERNSSVLES